MPIGKIYLDAGMSSFSMDTSWGTLTVEGRLGQQYHDFLNAVMRIYPVREFSMIVAIFIMRFTFKSLDFAGRISRNHFI